MEVRLSGRSAIHSQGAKSVRQMRYMRQKGARLGQHFLKAKWAATALVKSVSVKPDETIVEIGPGKGALTKELLLTGAHVVAVEKDEALVALLHETFAIEIASGQLTIVESDIREVTPASLGVEAGKYVVAANIPYYITGEIIRQFLSTDAQPRAMSLLIQKEVAQRIILDKESILSLSVKVYGTPRIIAKVSKRDFSPPPSVDSAILLIDNISRDRLGDIDNEVFFTIVRSGFASKRKMISNNIAPLCTKDSVASVLTSCAITPTARAETVPLGKWLCLAKHFSK